MGSIFAKTEVNEDGTKPGVTKQKPADKKNEAKNEADDLSVNRQLSDHSLRTEPKPDSNQEVETSQATQSSKVSSKHNSKNSRRPKGPIELKLVVVGDNAVGKSCLITAFLHNTFNKNYEPSVLDVYRGTKTLKPDRKKEISYQLEMHDTSGDDALSPNRAVIFKGADVFMICVAKDKRDSFDNINKWKQEIQAVERDKPIMLILTKDDIKGFEAQVSSEDLKKFRTESYGSFSGVRTTSALKLKD